MKKDDYPQLKSIVKAFKILETITNKDEYRLSELSKELKCPASSVHRILFTLKSLGYVKQNPRNGSYSASLKVFELGGKVIGNLNVAHIAKSIIVELAEKTGESIELTVLDGAFVVCIDTVESKHHLSIEQPVGSRTNACNSSNGKAILAHLPKEQLTEMFINYTFKQDTANSLKSFADLEKDLQKTRIRGYAIDDEEYLMGVRCVGAPIFNNEAKVVAGLSISGPVLRIDKHNISYLGKQVISAANQISKQLGFTYR